jgi:hypothetical protein
VHRGPGVGRSRAGACVDWFWIGPLALKHLHAHPHTLAEAGGGEATASSVGSRRDGGLPRAPGARGRAEARSARARATWPLVSGCNPRP